MPSVAETTREPAASGAPATPTHAMQCMEVWGGNTAVDNGVVMPGLDVWVLGRPYAGEHSGGDVHYVSSCASGRITRMLVADVSGHGVVVNDIALTLRSLMRRFVNTVQQGKFVGELNETFAGITDSGCFATAAVATYFEPTRTLTLSIAGHPRPLLYRAAEKQWSVAGTASSLSEQPRNLPLGVLDDTGYDETKIKLAAGDLVLFYTDSMMEARDAEGRMLGEQGLLRLLAQLTAEGVSAAGLPRALFDRVHAAGSEPSDDVTLLLLRPNTLSPRSTLLGLLTVLYHSLARRLSPSREPAFG
ncbi:MAG: PP2C family protein-serine/threonine phosphatase [Planctomycetota bacterium]|nr:PP2C family protein-serine/threonine phosphatase [Planctomycetota bacterium]